MFMSATDEKRPLEERTNLTRVDARVDFGEAESASSPEAPPAFEERHGGMQGGLLLLKAPLRLHDRLPVTLPASKI